MHLFGRRLRTEPFKPRIVTELREGKVGEKARTQDVVVDVLSDGDSAERSASSRDEEIRLVRKLDKRILPLLCAMYLFACKQTYSH